MSSRVSPDAAVLKEAANWAMTLRYGAPTDAERQAFDRWRQSSPAHEAAWARAQAVFQTFSRVPEGIGKDALQSLAHSQGRRQSMRLLGGLMVALPAGWLAWQHLPWRASWYGWTADAATAIGERKAMSLPDGSRVVLNTASAVDMAFSAAQRRIRLLAGEILVTTHADAPSANRPFWVDTAHGVVRALGTRFSVRHLNEDTCRVAVFEHAVEIRPMGGASRILRVGEQAEFNASGVMQPQPVDNTATLWEQGMLLAKNMRLADVIGEMARYRPGVLRCEPQVADLRVSGAIALNDTDTGLALLAHSLPVRIERTTRYWVRVLPLE